MARHDDLYHLAYPTPVVPKGLPLVALLTGFADAGGTVAGALDYAHNTLDSDLIASFENDVFLDYRARRPIVRVEKNRLHDYRPPRLELSLARDALGQPFLLLAGYEPDFVWDAFVDALLTLATRFEVASVTWTHAFAMPVPHTRELGATVSGNRESLIEELSVWSPRTQVPSTVGHFIEFRAVEAQLPTAGFAMLIPHYLAETDYPAATLASLSCIASATGLVFDLDEMTERNAEYLVRVDDQIAENEELRSLVAGLEERHDTYMAGRREAVDDDASLDEGDLPSADELAAEFERYLATRRGGEDDRPSS